MKKKMIWLSAAFLVFTIAGNVNATYIGTADVTKSSGDIQELKNLIGLLTLEDLYSMDDLLNLAPLIRINVAEGTVGEVKSDDYSIDIFGDGQTGTWSTTSPGGVDFVLVKGANQFAVYDVGGASQGDWTTNQLLTPNGKNNPTLSHITFYTKNSGGGSSAVPEPTTMALLFGGLGIMGYNTFRKKFAKK